MPNRPRPVPAPKAFDVFKPGKGQPSPTSRPVIVSHKPQVQDSTLVEEHGSPVPNARGTQPRLQFLSPRRVAPSAHAVHHGIGPTVSKSAPTSAEPKVVPDLTSTKKISHAGHLISRPSGSTATNHAALLHHKVSPPHERVTSTEPEKPQAPSLAAVPITPVEQPAGLANAKTEGKEELLAAMPVEIRRSVANAEGKSAADWDMPPEVVTQIAPTAATPTPIQVPAVSVDPPVPAIPQAEVVPAQAPAAIAKQAVSAEIQSAEEVPLPPIKTDRKHSSDAIVFIIMLVLFLGLGTVVALLFISGTIAL